MGQAQVALEAAEIRAGELTETLRVTVLRCGALRLVSRMMVKSNRASVKSASRKHALSVESDSLDKRTCHALKRRHMHQASPYVHVLWTPHLWLRLVPARWIRLGSCLLVWNMTAAQLLWSLAWEAHIGQ